MLLLAYYCSLLTFVEKHHYLLEDFHEGHVVVAIFLQKI